MPDQLSENIKKHLKTLSIGLIQNSSSQIYQAHQELYRIGNAVIPFVEKRILSNSWNEIRHGSELNLLTGLLCLVNDIDESRAAALGERIKNSGCSAIVNSRVTSVTTFTLNEFHAYEIRGLKLFQSKALGESHAIRKKITKWLRFVPRPDLEKIERIYVIPGTSEDYRGTYMPILCNIMVEWDLPVSYYNPLSWLFLLQIEKTLYHEIGHHVYRHTFGQDPEQEKEADQYAAALLKISHPVFSVMFRSLRTLLSNRSGTNEKA